MVVLELSVMYLIMSLPTVSLELKQIKLIKNLEELRISFNIGTYFGRQNNYIETYLQGWKEVDGEIIMTKKTYLQPRILSIRSMVYHFNVCKICISGPL